MRGPLSLQSNQCDERTPVTIVKPVMSGHLSIQSNLWWEDPCQYSQTCDDRTPVNTVKHVMSGHLSIQSNLWWEDTCQYSQTCDERTPVNTVKPMMRGPLSIQSNLYTVRPVMSRYSECPYVTGVQWFSSQFISMLCITWFVENAI